MNHWQYDQYKQIDEFSRQCMISELKADQLVRQYRIYHPSIFAKAMFKLENWMIAKGTGLRHRYEIPSTNNCTQSTSRNFI